jgi:metaxin
VLYLTLGYKPKPRAKMERTEEEKTFRRRAKYFLATQLVAVLVFLSLLGGVDSSELDDDDMDHED